MPGILYHVRQTAVMAVIATTLLFVPVAAVLALVSFAVFDISLHTLVTFADRFNAFVGLLLWWCVIFVPALGYAAFVMPPPSAMNP